MADINVDVVIIGAGFAGCLSLHHMRRRRFSAKIIEAGSDFGGVWYWNRYPGAQVDSEMPNYQFSSPEIFNDFSFHEFYPDATALRNYFGHVDKRWDLRKDAIFNQRVTEARYDGEDKKWKITTEKGLAASSRFIIFAVVWPEDVNFTGKKTGIIGQGASGTQIFEHLACRGHDVTVFLRTPPIAFPMRNRAITGEENKEAKKTYESHFSRSKYGEVGFPFLPYAKPLSSESADQNRAHMEKLWEHGGLMNVTGNYIDILVDKTANETFYNFWSEKVRARMTDEAKKETLAPPKPVQPLGTKRSTIENKYYELMDGENVTLVNLQKTPIKEFASNGIVTSSSGTDGDETLHHLDVVVVATGYDSVTGSLYDINIVDKQGKTLQEKWKDGIRTYFGMMVPDMPNAFILYGPQAPTSLANGPTFLEMEVEWIDKLLDKMEGDHITSIEPTKDEAEAWNQKLQSRFTLLPHSKAPSWWVGANTPGKRREPLVWFGGTKAWSVECTEALSDWSHFITD
ncbi:FAD dependent oxidoreductase [Pochonia chlamydosporia 170]|uniref:FAD dependent oxidoreductase n=1 Tax=Pochonia chlamydosporia 170 TaxID=1380566 RepID=A0A179FJ70_METCM|nr:FAD dependent oxidoreductase [Pochonia chlamydosporia 170]OAQ65348.1 FAD dependent oxidoreductase [Pochonia chlamydosporia 170]